MLDGKSSAGELNNAGFSSSFHTENTLGQHPADAKPEAAGLRFLALHLEFPIPCFHPLPYSYPSSRKFVMAETTPFNHFWWSGGFRYM